MNFSSWVKLNESCSRKKHLETNVHLLFMKNGHVATVSLESCSTVNSEWYRTIYLTEICGAGSFFTITTRALRQQPKYLFSENIELLSYLPYTPDLVPNDFFLLSSVRINYMSNILDARTSGWCFKMNGDTSNGMWQVLWKWVQMYAEEYWSSGIIFCQTIKSY